MGGGVYMKGLIRTVGSIEGVYKASTPEWFSVGHIAITYIGITWRWYSLIHGTFCSASALNHMFPFQPPPPSSQVIAKGHTPKPKP